MYVGVPSQLMGLAIIVNVLSFIAIFLGFLCIFMLYRHEERFSYILLLNVFCTFGAVLGVIQHMDYTVNWETIMTTRWEISQKSNYKKSMMLGKSDPGWRGIMSWMTIYCYNVDSLLVLFWAITLFIGTFNIRMRSHQKKVMSITLKLVSIILPALMLGVASIDVIHDSPIAFLIIINAIMFSCLTIGSMIVFAVLYKYLISREVFKRIFAATNSTTSASTARNGTSTTASGHNARSRTDKWLIVRFGIIMAILLIFEAAVIVYEIVNFQSNQQQTEKTTNPTARSILEQSKVDLMQYIPGAAPPIIAFLVFGTTAPFRKEYAKAVRKVCCCFSRPKRAHARQWFKITKNHKGLTLCHGDVEMIDSRSASKDTGNTFNIQEILSSPVTSPVNGVERTWEATTTVQPVRIQRTTSFTRSSTPNREPLYSVAIWSGNRSPTVPVSPRRFPKVSMSDEEAASPRNILDASPGDFWRWPAASADGTVGRSRPRSVSAGPTLVSTQPRSQNGFSPRSSDASPHSPGKRPNFPTKYPRSGSGKTPFLRLETDVERLVSHKAYRSAEAAPPVPPIPAATHWRQNSVGEAPSPVSVSRCSTSSSTRKVGFSEPLVIPSVLPSVIRESETAQESYFSVAPSESSVYTSSLSEEMRPSPLFSPSSSPHHSRSGSATPLAYETHDGERTPTQFGGSLRPPSPVSFAPDSSPRRAYHRMELKHQDSSSTLLPIQGTDLLPPSVPSRPPSPPPLLRLHTAPPATSSRRPRSPPPVPLDVFDGPL